MLKATKELIEHIKLKRKDRDYGIMISLINCILIFGSKEDASLLLEQYLVNISSSHHNELLPIFKKFGNEDFAKKIFEKVIDDDNLIEPSYPEVLEVIAHLGYVPIKPVLAKYAFQKKEDYYCCVEAIMGLLHFDCQEYTEDIEKGIQDCYGKAIFPEFLPALVCKLPNKEEYIEPLYELGNEYASSDCNGGIVLGIALCGGKKSQYFFEKILFDQNWEAHPTGTGTARWAYKGFNELGMTFNYLYSKIKTLQSREQAHALEVLFGFVKSRINEYENLHQESIREIYTLLYKWEDPNKSNNVTDLARKADLSEKSYQIEKLLRIKMTEENIIKMRK